MNISMGFPGDLVAKNPPAMQEMSVWSLGREDPLEKEMATHSQFLHGKPYEQRSLAGYSPWDHKRVWHNLATKHQHKYDKYNNSQHSQSI